MGVDSFFKKYPIKIFALLVSVMLFLFYFEKQITNVVKENFLTQSDFSHIIIDAILLNFVLVLSFFWGYKIIIKEYLPSLFQKTIIVGLIFLSIYFYYKSPWNYLEDNLLGVSYLLYVLTPLLTSVLFYSVMFFWRVSDRYFNFLPKITKANILISDDPILDEEDDILSYQPKINRLTQIILNDNFKKSISIGLVGPWGNGKSSVIYMTQKQIRDKTSKDEVIMIHFLPYLNHNEEDIINEFFTSFSNELSTYSGKLSSQILEYAKKLTDVYQGSNVFNLLEKHITNTNQSSAKELYDNINNRLAEINKKIIVFVDDLDRLSGKEIIQVLKLIRNTANFRNTIFVVAMDKDYVINRLKTEKNISSTRFIDKFFQLEIYLPVIDKTILRNYVYTSLKNSVLNNTVDFEINLSKGIKDESNLFDDFIKNLRDAKRLVNQIIFDYNFLREEINFKDFMNFTYFKLKFPKFMELLNHNSLDFLKIENGEYRLKEKAPPTEGEETFTGSTSFNALMFIDGTKFNDYSYLNKYAVSDLLMPSQDCLKSILSIDCNDVLLLSKTLAYLFGNQNKVVSFNSIKKENNFNMLMQQRVFENVLLESEFQDLIKQSEIGLITNILESLFNQNKLNQLIERLDYFSSDEKNLISNAILILFRLFEKRKDYNINDQLLLYKMANFVEKLISNGKEFSKKHVNWIKADLFESNFLSSDNKMLILSELWESKDENKLWQMGEDYVSEKAFILFKEYLASYTDNLWSVNDYTFYRHYHDLKNINNLKEKINKAVKEFWKNNNVELLCAQSTDTPAFSMSSFKISDTVSEIYESKIQFHEFVKSHSDSPSDAVKEFLELFELHQITGYSVPIIYNFEHSKLMLEKITQNTNVHGRSGYDENENYLQIVFETNSDLLISEIVELRRAKSEDNSFKDQYPNIDISFRALDLLQFSVFTFGGNHYLFLSYDKKYSYRHGIEVLKAFEAIVDYTYAPKNNNFKPYKAKLTQKAKIVIFENIYLKVISIQTAQNLTK